MDSPGHTAQYCSYTFMENNTDNLVHNNHGQTNDRTRKSTNLEKACLIKGLQFLLQNGLNVVEVITDAHVQIAVLINKCQNNT